MLQFKKKTQQVEKLIVFCKVYKQLIALIDISELTHHENLFSTQKPKTSFESIKSAKYRDIVSINV